MSVPRDLLGRIIHASGARDLDQFLAETWQRAPRCLAQVAGDLTELVSPEAVLELAAEPHVESRLVTEAPGGHLRLRQGPFTPTQMAELPERGWTVLVQDVDKHLPRARELLDAFNFLPRWRLDDLMVSYAAPGGSVGPHVDSYDVFLFQALGRRSWELSYDADSARLCDGCDLKVLQEFKPQASYELAPGDCLYLPANVGHHGVALEHCMTFSVGFRAATGAELLGAGPLLSELSQIWLSRGSPRYLDSATVPVEHSGELSQAARRYYRELVQKLLTLEPSELNRLVDIALARYLTEPKESQCVDPPARSYSREQVRLFLTSGGALEQHHATRWLFFGGLGGEPLQVCVDGESQELPQHERDFIALLCDSSRIPTEAVLSALAQPDHGERRWELVLNWLETGQLRLS